jgi:hypothetical protein
MKTWQVGIFLLAIVALVYGAPAQSTQPAQDPLDSRATTAFTQGQYAMALPLLQELAGTLMNQPERLGPVEERIRVCKSAIAAALKAVSDKAATQPGADLSAGRTPHPAPLPGQVVDLDINELGNFNFDRNKGGYIPADVMRLNGATFRTRGYMIPLDQAGNISEFALLPSLSYPFFDSPTPVQHVVVVHLPTNCVISYFPNELEIEGILKVRETKEKGVIVSIFELNATSVKPAPK